MLSYKQIVKNMVEMEVSNFIEKHSENVFPTLIGEVTLSTQNKELGLPTFELEMNVPNKTNLLHHDYLISGYVSEYGSVVVCSVCFERKIRKNGEKEFKKIREFIHGEELKTFKFDR